MTHFDDLIVQLGSEATSRERSTVIPAMVTAVDEATGTATISFSGRTFSGIPYPNGALIETGIAVPVQFDGPDARIISPTVGEWTSTAPGQVVGLVVAAGPELLDIDWPESSEFDMAGGSGRYQVQVDTAGTFVDPVRDVITLATAHTAGGLTPDTLHHIRVRAIDASGAPGAWSATVTATPTAGGGGSATDGNPPASSPTPTVTGGPGFLWLRWSAVTNADPVTYDVHLSASSGFTPGAGTLAVETPATSTVLRTMPDGSLLGYDTRYVRIVARDPDGAAAAGPQVAGSVGHPMGGANLIPNAGFGTDNDNDGLPDGWVLLTGDGTT